MATSLRWIFAVLFGCHHRRVRRMFTIERRTYQVCCDCGKHFKYSWERMHRIPSRVAGNAYACLDYGQDIPVYPPGHVERATTANS